MKKIFFVAIIIISMFLMSCETGSTELTTSTPFLGGDEGISINFLDGMPPDFVFDNSGYEFTVGLELINAGEDDVGADEGYVEIIGINPTDFNKGSQGELKMNLGTDLQGTKKNFEGSTIPGDRTFVEFNGLNYVGDLNGNTGLKIRAEMCYKYTTYTSSKLCMKKRVVENINNDKICDLSGEKNPYNSGGPVQITSLKETPSGDQKIQISFVIENKRNGIIFRPDAVCDERINNPDLNVIWVDVKTDIDGVFPVCNGLTDGGQHQGFVTLFSNEPRTVTCSIDLSGVDSIFEKVYEIDLTYNYFQFIERPLEVRDVN